MLLGDICKSGHPITIDNIANVIKSGQGVCRICLNKRQRLAKIRDKKKSEMYLAIVKNMKVE